MILVVAVKKIPQMEAYGRHYVSCPAPRPAFDKNPVVTIGDGQGWMAVIVRGTLGHIASGCPANAS
jgi:hypothetical protein